jgi:hypothetical protein
MLSCQFLNDVFVGAGIFFFLFLAVVYAAFQVRKK